MKVIVTGGRDYTDSVTFFREMDKIHAQRKIELVIEGGQRTRDRQRGTIGGADYWAYMWAASRRVPTVRVDADWNDLSQPDARIMKRGDGSKFDAEAGPRRNQRMIDHYQPDAVICTRGGRGTADMVRRAYQSGLEVIRIAQ